MSEIFIFFDLPLHFNDLKIKKTKDYFAKQKILFFNKLKHFNNAFYFCMHFKNNLTNLSDNSM